jgi:hypothetical protein
MTHENYVYESSCGKGRRGCCIIQPDDDSGNIILLDIVYGLPDGQPSIRSMVLVKAEDLAGELSETAG